jgi:hypothetical protein
LKSAVTQAMRDKVAKCEITTLRAFVDEQQRIQAEFAELLKPLEVSHG